MRKKIIMIAIFLGVIPVLIAGYKMIEYYDYQSATYERNMGIQEESREIDAEIIEKKLEKEQIENSQNEKIGILELWKKRLAKIKS